MIIKKIFINNKYFKFGKRNLVFSNDINSVGKSSFLRIIAYSLGFSIPSTKGFRFNDLELKIIIENNNHEYIIERYKNKINLIIDEKQKLFYNNSEIYLLHSIIFNNDDENIIKNLLGSLYIDQEKGWTLLNRGKAIGNNKFNIEQLIEGIDKSNIIELKTKLKMIEKDIIFYKKTKQLIDLTTEEYSKNDTFDFNSIDENKNKIINFRIEINKLKAKINDIKNVQKENDGFINFIEDFDIKISYNGEKISVNKNNIIGISQNNAILNARIISLNRQLDNLMSEYNNFNEKVKYINLVDTQDEMKKFKEYISKMSLTRNAIDKIISNLFKEKKVIKNKIDNIVLNAPIVELLDSKIKSYSKELGVFSSIEDVKNFSLTTSLKEYTGAKLHLIIFAYRLSVIEILKEKIGLEPPLIIDSPSTGELTFYNLKKMFKLLNDSFGDYQIIVAALVSSKNRDIKDIDYHWDKKLELKTNLLDSLPNESEI